MDDVLVSLLTELSQEGSDTLLELLGSLLVRVQLAVPKHLFIIISILLDQLSRPDQLSIGLVPLHLQHIGRLRLQSPNNIRLGLDRLNIPLHDLGNLLLGLNLSDN